jgi:hypothetical protein
MSAVSKGPELEPAVVIAPETVGEVQADAFRLVSYAGLKSSGPAPVEHIGERHHLCP